MEVNYSEILRVVIVGLVSYNKRGWFCKTYNVKRYSMTYL